MIIAVEKRWTSQRLQKPGAEKQNGVCLKLVIVIFVRACSLLDALESDQLDTRVCYPFLQLLIADLIMMVGADALAWNSLVIGRISPFHCLS